MSKKIKCLSRATASFYAPNGDTFTLPARTYLLVNESDLTPERTMNGGGFRVGKGDAFNMDSGATNTETIWVDAADPAYRYPAAN